MENMELPSKVHSHWQEFAVRSEEPVRRQRNQIMRLKIGVHQSDAVGESPPSSDPIPIIFPCLLWDADLDILLLATRHGIGVVLSPGRSREFVVGDIVPYAASRWADTGAEQHDFMPAPIGMSLTLTNTN